MIFESKPGRPPMLKPRRRLQSLARAVALIAVRGWGGAVEAQNVSRTEPPIHRTGPNDLLLSWAVQPIWELPGSGSAGLFLSRLSPSDLAVHPTGTTFLLDRGGPMVYAISTDGTVTDSLGRAGGGPGEFRRPISITVDLEGNVSVLDRNKRAFVRWDAGSYEPISEAPGASFVVGAAEFVPGGIVYRTLRVQGRGITRYDLVLKPDAGDPQVLVRGPPMVARTVNFPSCQAYDLTVPELFSSKLPWDGRNGRIVVAPDESYSLTVFDGTRAVLRIVRDIPSREVTREMALRDVVGYTVHSCEVPPDEAVREMGHAALMPAVRELRISNSGEIWVRRRVIKGESEKIDVFTSDGSYVGTLPTSFPFPAAFISNDSFLSISQDAYDVPVITAYKIVRH